MTETTGNLGGVLKRGAAMSAVGLVLAQGATVVQTVVVGRILGPAEVGIFTAGTILIGFLVTFSQGGLAQALIQRATDVENAANTALVATVVTGVLGSLGVLAASPLIGAIFHSSRVGHIAAASSGLIALYALASVPDALMQRAFQFRRQMIITPTISIVLAGVAIVFALRGYGAWSMVIGWYVAVVTAVVLSWWMARWRPFGGRFSFHIWRDMAGFSFPVLLDAIADRTREVIEQAIVGRVLGTSDLGHYRYAYRIASLPSLALITTCAHVLFPAFSRISDDSTRFRQAFMRALGWVWFAAAPGGVLMIALGQPVVVLMLGEEWRAAGTAAAAMAGIGLGAALNAVTGEAMKGAGRSSLLNWSPAICLGLGLPLILLFVPFGLVGVGIAISVTCLVVGIVNLELARGVVGASRREITKCLLPTSVSAVVAAVVLWPLEHYVVRSDHFPELTGLGLVLAECVLFTIVYLSVMRVAAPAMYQTVLGALGRGVAKATGPARRA
ncbi:lipopolysaccharide biosynthesis protein [Mycolicibacterium moriokaense]|nr:lipopolysaccharide biosynthesis protein [Mycolicibacterium moriokaense]